MNELKVSLKQGNRFILEKETNMYELTALGRKRYEPYWERNDRLP